MQSDKIESTSPQHRALSLDGSMRILVVGDVHDAWGEEDEAALTYLSPNLILFVGDYGNENVELVRRIAEFCKRSQSPVVTALGNHEAIYLTKFSRNVQCQKPRNEPDPIRAQLELLSAFNAGYRSISLKDNIGISVVGGRPFSSGGPHWSHAQLYNSYLGVTSMRHSADKIAAAAEKAEHSTLIFLSHQGPTGLGSRPDSPCGRDWGETPGGDWGDPDLRHGIIAARNAGKSVPLVVFGHMHSRTKAKGCRARMMVAVEADGSKSENTIMVNAAMVPRHKKRFHDRTRLYETLCQFTAIQLAPSGYVDTVEQIWCSAGGEIVERTVLIERGQLKAKENELMAKAENMGATIIAECAENDGHA